METQNSQVQDLKEIKNLMERSTRFLSLSGLSSVVAGIIAIIGAGIAYFLILDNGRIIYNEHFDVISLEEGTRVIKLLIIDALLVLVFAFVFALYFSKRKAKRLNTKFWTKATKRVLYNFTIPLLAGGAFTLILIQQHNIHLVASSTLIFYGIALLNASNFTFSEIRYLGICEIIIGLLAGIFLYYGIFFWVIGFGILHIIYGALMYYKYER
ncbi:MAG: hypothetical protein CL663_04735 [Bacteroidetes bacterium]|nr:hypothetical protein [Bacteroidota bacterium]